MLLCSIQDPWMEYVDWDGVSYGVDRLVTQWLQVTRPTIYKNNGLSARDQEIDGNNHHSLPLSLSLYSL